MHSTQLPHRCMTEFKRNIYPKAKFSPYLHALQQFIDVFATFLHPCNTSRVSQMERFAANRLILQSFNENQRCTRKEEDSCQCLHAPTQAEKRLACLKLLQTLRNTRNVNMSEDLSIEEMNTLLVDWENITVAWWIDFMFVFWMFIYHGKHGILSIRENPEQSHGLENVRVSTERSSLVSEFQREWNYSFLHWHICMD